MALYEKYLKESNNSPIGISYQLLNDLMNEFMSIAKKEVEDLKNKELEVGYKKLSVQYNGFKKFLTAFVKRLEKEL